MVQGFGLRLFWLQGGLDFAAVGEGFGVGFREVDLIELPDPELTVVLADCF